MFKSPITKGDKPKSKAQLARTLKLALDNVFTADQRDMLIVSQPEFAASVGGVLTEVQQEATAINAFNQNLFDYRAAIARLEKYRKADGQAEVTELFDTGLVDENGDPILETITVKAFVEALPLTVEVDVFDPETGESTLPTVPNPDVASDDAERQAAQEVIDATPQDVKDFINE